MLSRWDTFASLSDAEQQALDRLDELLSTQETTYSVETIQQANATRKNSALSLQQHVHEHQQKSGGAMTEWDAFAAKMHASIPAQQSISGGEGSSSNSKGQLPAAVAFGETLKQILIEPHPHTPFSLTVDQSWHLLQQPVEEVLTSSGKAAAEGENGSSGKRGGERTARSEYCESVFARRQLFVAALEGVDSVIDRLAQLDVHFGKVIGNTAQARMDCKEFVAGQAELTAEANALRSHLAYFDEAEEVALALGLQLESQSFGASGGGNNNQGGISGGGGGTSSSSPPLPLVQVQQQEFLQLLERLDACLLFMKQHTGFGDVARYFAAFQRLHNQVLTRITDQFEGMLKQVTEALPPLPQLLSEGTLTSSIRDDGAAADEAASLPLSSTQNATAALLPASIQKQLFAIKAASSRSFIEFRSAADTLLPLLHSVEQRSLVSHQYLQLLHDLQRAYCRQREGLTVAQAQQYVQLLSHKASHLSLADLSRLASSYLMELCTLEYQLFQHIFALHSTSAEHNLNHLLTAMCSVLHTEMRPMSIHLTDLDALCEAIMVLRTEIVACEVLPRGSCVAPFVPVIDRVVQDLQERLAFCAQTYIRQNIRLFTPTAEQIDYPTLLDSSSFLPSPTPSPHETAVPAVSSSSASPLSAASVPSPISTTVWYPPLIETLLTLSKLYRCLDLEVFKWVGNEAVWACTQQLLQAAQQINAHSPLTSLPWGQRVSPVLPPSVLSQLTQVHGDAVVKGACAATDGLLFLVRHLLYLREQISPFQVDFLVSETSLDFSHLSKQIPALFSWGSLASLWSKVDRTAPLPISHSREAKKDTEHSLKLVCQLFIAMHTSCLLGPLIAFSHSLPPSPVTATAAASSPVHLGVLPPETKRSLKGNLLMSLRRIDVEVPEKNSETLDFSGKLQAMRARCRLYLNPVTEKSLHRPIQANIRTLIGQLLPVAQQLQLQEPGDDDDFVIQTLLRQLGACCATD